MRLPSGGAGFIEQQNIDIARDRAAHREHIALQRGPFQRCRWRSTIRRWSLELTNAKRNKHGHGEGRNKCRTVSA
jgi:hypothetical protein